MRRDRDGLVEEAVAQAEPVRLKPDTTYTRQSLDLLVNITSIIRLYRSGLEMPPVDGLCKPLVVVRPIRPTPNDRSPEMTPVPFSQAVQLRASNWSSGTATSIA